MTMSQTSIDSWDGLLKNYLKAEHLNNQEETFICVGATVENEGLDLELEKDSEKYTFTLNVTNMVFLKNHGLRKPKEVIGRKITLKKVLVTNPTTRKEVQGLRISKVD